MRAAHRGAYQSPVPPRPATPAPGFGSSRTFSQKLGIYLLGIAIGLMLYGWFQVQKRRAAGPPPPPPTPAEQAPPPAADPG